IDRSGDGSAGAGDRPSLAPGMSNNPTSGTTTCFGVPEKLQTVARYYDPCAFALPDLGTYGNLGANTIIGPGFVNFDFAVHKTFNFTERVNLQFRGEFFNLFNTPGFGDFARSIFRSATGGPGGTPLYNGSAGRILDTLNTSRQIQFGMKLGF
ncbi:MAG: outer rane receptor protein, partial [Acidobacteria bacterium]|nr:outer rane receptor protein [Acidobacteriota bacterium]